MKQFLQVQNKSFFLLPYFKSNRFFFKNKNLISLANIALESLKHMTRIIRYNVSLTFNFCITSIISFHKIITKGSFLINTHTHSYTVLSKPLVFSPSIVQCSLYKLQVLRYRGRERAERATGNQLTDIIIKWGFVLTNYRIEWKVRK